MKQIYMSLAKLQVAEIAAYKGKIEPATVEGDQEVVGVYSILEFLHILSIDKVVGVPAVVETDHGNLMAVNSHAGGFDVQKGTTVSKIIVESPAFSRRENIVKISSLVPVLPGLPEAGPHQVAVLAAAGPMVKVQLQSVPGQNTLTPEIYFCLWANVGEM